MILLRNLKKWKKQKREKGYVISYEKRRGLRKRIRQQKDEIGDTSTQILMPKSLRKKSDKDGLRFSVWKTFGSEKTYEFRTDCFCR